MTNLKQIAVAVKLFYDDEHRYPEFIAGPVSYDADGNVVPIERSRGTLPNGTIVALYPEYIKSVLNLKCPLAVLHGTVDGEDVAADYKSTDVVPDPMYDYWNSASPSLGSFGSKPDKAVRDIGENGAPFYEYASSTYDTQVPPGKTAREGRFSLMWMYIDKTVDSSFVADDYPGVLQTALMAQSTRGHGSYLVQLPQRF